MNLHQTSRAWWLSKEVYQGTTLSAPLSSSKPDSSKYSLLSVGSSPHFWSGSSISPLQGKPGSSFSISTSQTTTAKTKGKHEEIPWVANRMQVLWCLLTRPNPFLKLGTELQVPPPKCPVLSTLTANSAPNATLQAGMYQPRLRERAQPLPGSLQNSICACCPSYNLNHMPKQGCLKETAGNAGWPLITTSKFLELHSWEGLHLLSDLLCHGYNW